MQCKELQILKQKRTVELWFSGAAVEKALFAKGPRPQGANKRGSNKGPVADESVIIL